MWMMPLHLNQKSDYDDDDAQGHNIALRSDLNPRPLGHKSGILSAELNNLTLVLLNPDLSFFESTVDPDQLAPDKAI